MSDGIHLRDLEDGELEAIEVLGRRLYGEAAEAPVEVRRARMPGFCPVRLVAERAGGLVGYGGLFRDAWMIPAQTAQVDLLALPDGPAPGADALLLDRLLAECRRLELRTARATVRSDRAPFLSFLQEHGFVEDQRTWTLTLDPAAFDAPRFRDAVSAAEAQGIVFTRMTAERERDPEWSRRVHALWCAAAQDQPGAEACHEPPFEPFREWLERASVARKEAFIAIAGGEYAGMCMVQHMVGASSPRLTQNLTGVRREYRRRGLATALKVLAHDYARELGSPRVVSSVDSRNTAMLRLNERLGYQVEYGVVSLVRPLP